MRHGGSRRIRQPAGATYAPLRPRAASSRLLVLWIPFVPLPELVDGGVEFVDPLHALAQQDFQPLGIALLGCELVAQLHDLGAQRIVFFLELEFDDCGMAPGEMLERSEIRCCRLAQPACWAPLGGVSAQADKITAHRPRQT
jgi:hypothetical protein